MFSTEEHLNVSISRVADHRMHVSQTLKDLQVLLINSYLCLFDDLH